MRPSLAVLALLLLTACTPSADDAGSDAPTTSAPATTSAPTTSAPATSSSGAAPAAGQYPDWPTYHGSLNRAGVATSMPAVSGTPTVRSIKLDAAVYASPIVAEGIVVVATENDSVYGLTPGGGIRWHQRFGTPARRSQLPCGNIDPSGITGTPVYSATTGLVYFVVEHADPIRHELIAVDAHTGAERWSSNLPLPGTSQDAMQQRGALSLGGGRVWITFGGRAGDCGNYTGQLIGLPLSGSGAAVTYTVPTAREAGMWTPPGPTVDEAGHIYVAVGNGASVVGDAYDHSDSVLEFDSSAHLISSFSPSTWASENSVDADLGSQGPALVGGYVFQAGKSGTAYVLRRDALGGIGGQVSSVSLPCHSYGGTAVQDGVVYVPCTEGVRAIRISSTGQMTALWKAASGTTGSPVIGAGRIWALDTEAGVLHGLSPSTGQSLTSASVGAVSRFATPALYGPRVLIGTMQGLAIVTTS